MELKIAPVAFVCIYTFANFQEQIELHYRDIKTPLHNAKGALGEIAVVVHTMVVW